MKRMNLLKKATAFLLAGSMVMSLASCGSSTTTGSQSSSSSATSTETSTENAGSTDLYGEEVSIKVMVWDRGNAAAGTTTEDNALTKWISEQVKEKFNINVEYVSVPRSESDDKLNIMMSGGTAPDIIFTYDQSLFYNFANNGALHELSESYANYGANIAEYCAEAQGIGMVGDQQFAVMKQRGTESARHISYIRKDWLDELEMDIPTTKAELGEYLLAVKENNLGGSKTIPWAMSGRTDTEKMYLNFLGSYVDLPTERDEYIYNEAYMAIAPGAKEGLKLLNEWYNQGLITQEFPTDSAEDVYKSDIANGYVGFLLDDVYNAHASFEVLNNTLGKETFIPIDTFELSDGSYRLPYEYRHAMFVMIPATTSNEKVDACMKYLNWMADPEVAVNITYTPEHTVDENGVAIAPTEEVRNEKGYPGTCDDLSIMNLNFEWANDVETLAKVDFVNQTTEWASEEWYENLRNMSVKSEYKFRFPTYSYITEAEQTYGADVKTRMIEFVYRMICGSTADFEANYENGYKELVNAGLEKILEGRAEYFDSIN